MASIFKSSCSSVRLLTWNLLHGGSARRMPEITLRLLDHAPDIAVLTEFRASIGGQVAGVLADHGLAHQQRSPAAPDRNGILIASRFPLRAPVTAMAPATPCPLPAKWAEVEIPDLGLRLAGVHIPDASRPTERAAYWQFLVEYARRRGSEPCIVMGDFNTGRHRADEAGATFGSTALLGAFCTLGFCDAYRAVHPEGRDRSWVSHEGGGFRIDHAFVTRGLLPSIASAAYSHSERTEGSSDHAALLLDLSIASPSPPPAPGGKPLKTSLF